jgi:hypothetical protein
LDWLVEDLEKQGILKNECVRPNTGSPRLEISNRACEALQFSIKENSKLSIIPIAGGG